MSFLNNLKIRSKLALMMFFPLAGLLYFSSSGILEKYQLSRDMHDLELLSQLAVKISALVHETQKERGRTAGYLGSKGTRFVSEISVQRSLTDAKIASLKVFLKTFNGGKLSKEFKEAFDKGMVFLDVIEKKRNLVSELDLSAREAIGWYTDMNAAFLDSIGFIGKISKNAELSTLITAYVNFLQGKERAGIERAVMSSTFAADHFDPGMYSKFMSLVEAQNTYMRVFLGFAPAEQKEYYRSKLQGEYVSEVLRMRKVAIEKAATGSFGIAPGYWFKMITGKINLLKEVEDKLSTDLYAKAKEFRQNASLALVRYIIITVFAFLFAIIAAYFINSGITTPVIMQRKSMEELASGGGDLTLRVDVAGSDEVAQASMAFNKFMDGLQEMIRDIKEAANSIASASEQISSSTEELAAGVDNQSRQSAEIGSAIEEMASSVQATFANSQKSLEVSKKTSETAARGGQIVSNTMEGMSRIEYAVSESSEKVQGLGERSRQIGKIVEVIKEIAAQTNLLALNAAIEANRAGEHGRGFEVVAEEIRKLAEKSADSTVRITEIVEEIQGDTSATVASMTGVTNEVSEGSKLSNDTGEALQHIINQVKETVDSIEMVAEASKQQAAVSDEVAVSMENIATIIKETAASSEEIAQTSQELARLGDNLRRLTERFKI
ncbi:MAG: methyl-accepting chemotaxis protein [Deltaproteobacteria bacterium]|nr:methyl-accepting chemotaxis protein [Deltaproteobacteria bacterium]